MHRRRAAQGGRRPRPDRRLNDPLKPGPSGRVFCRKGLALPRKELRTQVGSRGFTLPVKSKREMLELPVHLELVSDNSFTLIPRANISHSHCGRNSPAGELVLSVITKGESPRRIRAGVLEEESVVKAKLLDGGHQAIRVRTIMELAV